MICKGTLQHCCFCDLLRNVSALLFGNLLTLFNRNMLWDLPWEHFDIPVWVCYDSFALEPACKQAWDTISTRGSVSSQGLLREGFLTDLLVGGRALLFVFCFTLLVILCLKLVFILGLILGFTFLLILSLTLSVILSLALVFIFGLTFCVILSLTLSSYSVLHWSSYLVSHFCSYWVSHCCSYEVLHCSSYDVEHSLSSWQPYPVGCSTLCRVQDGVLGAP